MIAQGIVFVSMHCYLPPSYERACERWPTAEKISLIFPNGIITLAYIQIPSSFFSNYLSVSALRVATSIVSAFNPIPSYLADQSVRLFALVLYALCCE